MSAISVSYPGDAEPSRHPSSTSISDGAPLVTILGGRRVYWGALFGFALGAVLAAISFSTDAVAFGYVGTLMIAATECIVIAIGFANLASAFCSGPRACADCPADPAPTATPHQIPDPAEDWATPNALLKIRSRLDTIEAWENGSTGP